MSRNLGAFSILFLRALLLNFGDGGRQGGDQGRRADGNGRRGEGQQLAEGEGEEEVRPLRSGDVEGEAEADKGDGADAGAGEEAPLRGRQQDPRQATPPQEHSRRGGGEEPQGAATVHDGRREDGGGCQERRDAGGSARPEGGRISRGQDHVLEEHESIRRRRRVAERRL